jgi:oligoribonuclease NrnB/cAMP/cGMP phosphodiesterase (DHH superfamily)
MSGVIINKRPLVIYHGDCFDGFCAAWVFRTFKGTECDFHPARYGEDPPDTSKRNVWVLDFSYPREQMMDLIVQSKSTTVFDHHKTAEANLENILNEIRETRGVLRQQDKIIFDMNRSGAGITFDELDREKGQKRGLHEPRYNGARSNWVVDYVEDRDLWRQTLPDTQAVSAWIATVPMTFDAYTELQKEGLDKAIERGQAVQKYIDIYGKKARKHSLLRDVGGHEVPVVNMPYMNCSEHVGALAEENPDRPFACGFFLRDDSMWQFSLRSRGDFDVSEIAKQYGGGGHKNAAGFAVDKLPWL